MSYVIAAPQYLAMAATDLADIGSSISSANQFALGPTSNVLAAGADEVSAAMSALFNSHAQVYQALSAQAAQFHAQFVQLMNGGSSEYALTEAANASPLQIVQQGAPGAINSPTQASAGRPPVGTGANGGPGTGASGAGRGILFGNVAAGASGLNGTNGDTGGSFGGTGGAGGSALTATEVAGGGQGGAGGLFATGGVGGIGAPAWSLAGPAAMAAQANGSVLTGPATPPAPPPQSVETAATTRPAAPETPAAAAPMARAASSAPATGPRAAPGDPGADGTAGVGFVEDGAEGGA